MVEDEVGVTMEVEKKEKMEKKMVVECRRVRVGENQENVGHWHV